MSLCGAHIGPCVNIKRMTGSIRMHIMYAWVSARVCRSWPVWRPYGARKLPGSFMWPQNPESSVIRHHFGPKYSTNGASRAGLHAHGYGFTSLWNVYTGHRKVYCPGASCDQNIIHVHRTKITRVELRMAAGRDEGLVSQASVEYLHGESSDIGCVYHHSSGVELRFPNDFQGEFCRW